MRIHQEISHIFFFIISVYFDDLNIIDNTQDIDKTYNHLKTEFEMKDFIHTKFFLGLQLEYIHSGILVHQIASKRSWRNSIWTNIIYTKLSWWYDI